MGAEVNEMKYLKVFTDFQEVLEPLTDEEVGRLFLAMLRYAMDGTAPQLSGNERFIWITARQGIDREAAANQAKAANMKRARPALTQGIDNTVPLLVNTAQVSADF